MGYTMEDVKRVKGMGFLFNRESIDEFSARVITGNGVMTAEQLQTVSEAAQKFGNGTVAFTTRMTLELPGVRYDDIPALQEFLARSELYTGGTGDRVRPVMSCKGTTCVFGQVDTQGIAQRIHELFFEGWKNVTLPHKFKIGVGGCPNNCIKPDLNDFGLVGSNVPGIDHAACKGCAKCVVEEVCLMGAAKVVNGKISIDSERCNFCGKCISACYFGCLYSDSHGVSVELGGKWGRNRRPATMLKGVYSVDEAMVMLKKALLVYRKYGYRKERFGDMIDRIGIELVEKEMYGDSILSEKDAILSAEIKEPPKA